MFPESRLFSVGHSNHSLDRLVELLRRAGVALVADVRSRPFSQWLPHFNRPELEEGLRRSGLAYEFLGDTLGGRPAVRNVYDDEGRVDYERVRQTAAFRKGLEQLCGLGSKSPTAMLCAEEDPLDCHRGLMITPALAERGVAPQHLRGDGTVESTMEMERRLLALTKVGAGIVDGMFATTLSMKEHGEYLRDAYVAQSSRKAFRLRQDDMADGEGS